MLLVSLSMMEILHSLFYALRFKGVSSGSSLPNRSIRFDIDEDAPDTDSDHHSGRDQRGDGVAVGF